LLDCLIVKIAGNRQRSTDNDQQTTKSSDN